MNTTQTTTATTGFEALVANVVHLGGGVIAGSPATLSAICAKLGFKNACRDGRVYLTGPKMARIGLAGRPAQVPGWHTMTADELAVAIEVAQYRAGVR